MSVPLNNVGQEGELRILLTELATKAEAFTAEQATLLTDKELGMQRAISGCMREMVLRCKRVAFLTKLGIELIGVPASVYATLVTSSVVHASPRASLPAAALMAVCACSQHTALWRRLIELVRGSVVSQVNRHAMRQLERRLTLMRLDARLPAMAINWRLRES
jgi:hypothetical protein